ncbi:sensor histidine kinase [Gordonia jinhuaensis]|nr:hypothetical protein [Gordonia jinhuaensis]
MVADTPAPRRTRRALNIPTVPMRRRGRLGGPTHAPSGRVSTARAPSDRLQRVLAMFVGAGFGAYLLVAIPDLAPTARILAWWWTPLALATSIAPGIVLFAVSLRGSRAAIDRACAVCAIGYLVAAASWFLAWNGELATGVRSTWLVNFPGLAALAAALTFSARWTLIHMALATGLSTATNDLGRVGRLVMADFIPEYLYALVFCLLWVAATLGARRTGVLLDASQDQAVAATRSAATVQARDSERLRFDGVIHDRVIATLAAAGRDGGGDGLAEQASSALSALDGLDAEADPDAVIDTVGVDIRIRDTLAAVSDRIDYSAVVRCEPGVCFPAIAVDTLCASLGEAARNSVRHAGVADREVRALIDTDGLRVVMADNGSGFDPAAVAPERLGIAVSIDRRMHDLDGGNAHVLSEPGAGTTVVLEWVR